LAASEVASLHRLKSNYANRAFPNLYRNAVGEQLCRLFCLIILRARQGVLIENVPFGREDKHLYFFVATSSEAPPKRQPSDETRDCQRCKRALNAVHAIPWTSPCRQALWQPEKVAAIT
jgi:hypothetical protein